MRIQEAYILIKYSTYYAGKFWQLNPFEIVENLEVNESSEPNKNKASCIYFIKADTASQFWSIDEFYSGKGPEQFHILLHN